MSEHLNPGTHPDADSLSAFIEGVSPEHERLACLAHLAECSRCREVVYLAQEPLREQVVPAEPVRSWKRWFTPIPALSAAAVVCALVVSIAVYRQYRLAIPAPELTASNRPPTEAAPTPEEPRQPPTPDAATAKNTPGAQAPVNRAPIPAVAPPPSPAAPPPPPPAASAPVIVNGLPAATVLAGIAGTVTDQAGSVIPRAQVNLVDDATGRVFTSTSDTRGQFDVAGLAPGRYQLNILSPGFKQTSKQIDLQPQQIAKADSILEVGALTETVTVNAEASLLKTESGAVAVTAAAPAAALPVLPAKRSRMDATYALPDKLPNVTTAAKDKLVLAADSAGALFLSKNAGKTWKAVKGRWQGKVVRLATTPDPANASNPLFQLTTDTASVWLSRDGSRWYQAPGQH